MGASDAHRIRVGEITETLGVVAGGPSMPGEAYSGHSEHEFIRREQFVLNLEMYTAVLAKLAGR